MDKYLKFVLTESEGHVLAEHISSNKELYNFVNETIKWRDGKFYTDKNTFYSNIIHNSCCLYVVLKDKYRLFGYDIEVV